MPMDDPLRALSQLASHYPDENPAVPMASGFEEDPLAVPATGTMSPRQLQPRAGQARPNDPLQTLQIAQAQLALRRRPAPLMAPPQVLGLSAALWR